MHTIVNIFDFFKYYNNLNNKLIWIKEEEKVPFIESFPKMYSNNKNYRLQSAKMPISGLHFKPVFVHSQYIDDRSSDCERTLVYKWTTTIKKSNSQ